MTFSRFHGRLGRVVFRQMVKIIRVRTIQEKGREFTTPLLWGVPGLKVSKKLRPTPGIDPTKSD